ncbi:protein EARLY FLOWERING [Trifolium repens]|nr:protein EARLY FLOWERING [Trifolium repens]
MMKMCVWMLIISVEGERIDTFVRQAKATPNQEFQDRAVFKLSSSRQGDGGSRQNCRAESQSNGTGQSDALVESTREINKSNGPTANHTNPSGAINDTEYHDTGTGSPIQRGNLNKNDNISKTSRVENLSTLNWFFIFAFKVLTDFLMVGTGYNRAVSLIYYTMSEGCHVTADHLIVYCLLATEFWMYSCLGFLLLSSPCHHWGMLPCTAPKDLS